jgi:hypothetical protein
MNEQSIKRMKKDIFALHIFNIDGKTTQRDFYKKDKYFVPPKENDLFTSKSSKYTDLSCNTENRKKIIKVDYE